MKTCVVEGCERPLRARGWCVTHYGRWMRRGDVNITNVIDPEVRFWSYVDKRGPDDCWHWTGNCDRGGYGRFQAGRQETQLAHRWSHKQFRGPVADDQHVDHTCHNRDRDCVRGSRCLHRRCVNPAHLEAVSLVVNAHRARGGTEATCPAGHPRTEENTVTNKCNGRKQCRICVRRNSREYQRRKRATSARAGSNGNPRDPCGAA